MPSSRFGFCQLSIVPLRHSPAHNSEMVSQLLFGEIFRISEFTDTWVKIVNEADNYIGWIHKKQFLPISRKTFDGIKNSSNRRMVSVMQGAIKSESNGFVYPIPFGSILPSLQKGKFSVEGRKFIYTGKMDKPPLKVKVQKLIQDAIHFLGSPYQWGGKSEYGIDCSGFTQLVFSVNGISLPRDAYQQAEYGTTLEFLEQSKPGDLAFFDNKEGKIIHVGILINSSTIIHASGWVRIDKLDLEGIWNEDEKKYSHHLRLLKRIL